MSQEPDFGQVHDRRGVGSGEQCVAHDQLVDAVAIQVVRGGKPAGLRDLHYDVSVRAGEHARRARPQGEDVRHAVAIDVAYAGDPRAEIGRAQRPDVQHRPVQPGQHHDPAAAEAVVVVVPGAASDDVVVAVAVDVAGGGHVAAEVEGG